MLSTKWPTQQLRKTLSYKFQKVPTYIQKQRHPVYLNPAAARLPCNSRHRHQPYPRPSLHQDYG
ncbi:protein of unknown function [Pseudomonas sp. JV551A1]|uniref:Uncharacterized protein n=1 Tax=Pseudomonas inefficax TaxID=2078786 RepID=A0AAQ1STQ4_9PSED|nr:protein of unknown function [Pseudomonas sp. JV551A1]SPO61151.1 protein of unknown function [Pseudomonas inefficax]